jgi:hypothetical protein
MPTMKKFIFRFRNRRVILLILPQVQKIVIGVEQEDILQEFFLYQPLLLSICIQEVRVIIQVIVKKEK